MIKKIKNENYNDINIMMKNNNNAKKYNKT